MPKELFWQNSFYFLHIKSCHNSPLWPKLMFLGQNCFWTKKYRKLKHFCNISVKSCGRNQNFQLISTHFFSPLMQSGHILPLGPPDSVQFSNVTQRDCAGSQDHQLQPPCLRQKAWQLSASG